jgi:hypothetical protein
MVEKLLDPQGKPLLSLEQHMRLLGALAEEMWWQETRELDEQTFLTIGELVCEEFGLEGVTAERFLNRMPTHALLSRSDRPIRVAFRHEFYFGYFLGTIIALRALQGEGVNDFLTRAVISTVVADEVAATLRYDGGERVGPLIDALDARRPSPSSVEVANQNAGTLFGALVREFGESLRGARLQSAFLGGLNLSNTRLREVSFRKCLFTEVDFRKCEWYQTVMEDCELTLVRLTDRGHFEVRGLGVPGSVSGVKVFPRDGVPYETYNPNQIRDVLVQLGCPIEQTGVVGELSESGRRLLQELDRFLRVIQRTLYFSEEDFSNRGLNLKADVGEIFVLLKRYGLLVEAKRQIKGQRALYRLTTSPDEIRKGEGGVFSSREIKDLWTAIRSAA